MEPRIAIDLVALDCNQPAAGIRSGNTDRNVVAAFVLRAIEFYLQLRIFLQRKWSVAVSNDALMQLAKSPILVVAKFDRVVSRLGGRERVMQTIRRNCEPLGMR